MAEIDPETIAAFVTLYAVLSEFIGNSKLKENTVYQVVIRILARCLLMLNEGGKIFHRVYGPVAIVDELIRLSKDS